MNLRIVSLAPTNTEILYALGLGSNVVGVTRFCDYPASARQKPRIGGWLDINMKAVRTLEPDIVVTSMFMQDNIVQQLEKASTPVIHTDPKTLEDVYDSILIFGKMFDKKYEAENIVSGMRSRIARIKKLVQDSPRKRTYIEEWNDPPTVAGNWVPDLLEAAGGTGITEPGERSRKVQLQEVREFDPEVIIAACCEAGNQEGREEIRKRGSWALTKAAMRDEIHMLSEPLLSRPTPRLADGCEAIARILHPEVFR